MASDSSPRQAPRSIPQIVATAGDFVYDPALPFKNWLRAARVLRQQAEIYEAEGDLERAYELYFRQGMLVLEKLPKHPEIRAAGNTKLWGVGRKDAEISLSRCEALKPYLKTAFEQWQASIEKRRARETELERMRAEGGSTRPGSAQGDYGYGTVPGRIERSSGEYTGQRWEEFEGHRHQDLALEIGRREQRSTAYQSRASMHTMNREQSLSQQMQGLRMRMDGKAPVERQSSTTESRLPLGRQSSPNVWSYPSVPESKPTVSGSQKELWLAGLGDQSNSHHPPPGGYPGQLSIRPPTRAPALPGKEPLREDGAIVPPARPPKGTFANSTSLSSLPPSLPPKSLQPTSIARDTRYFKISAYLENGTPLRTVFFPPQMRYAFLRLASRNTSRNLETCGILCGTLKQNALFIERLVIPEQESTSDTCEMTSDGEIALFDYCESNDLLTLGWIHTHPTQTCFMSSRDLHTHVGYQAMMPESIAIVCAPSQTPSDDWDAFRLTDEPGMRIIQTCKKPGIFHPHDGGPIYTGAQKPGHVVLLDGLGFDVHDMRK